MPTKNKTLAKPIAEQLRDLRQSRESEHQAATESDRRELYAIAMRDHTNTPKEDDGKTLDEILTRGRLTVADYQRIVTAIPNVVDSLARDRYYQTLAESQSEEYQAALREMHRKQSDLYAAQREVHRLREIPGLIREAADSARSAREEHAPLADLPGLGQLVSDRESEIAAEDRRAIADGKALLDTELSDRLRRAGLA